MTVNQAWRDAMMAVALNAFNTEERKAGWPQTMKPWQLANLQRPWTHDGSKQALKGCNSLLDGIEADCKAGVIPHTTEERVVKVPFTQPIPIRWQSAHWDGEAGKIRMVRGEKEETRPIHHITARAFAEWLAAQGIEPSQHIAAWFKAQGVTAAAQAAPEPAPAAQAVPEPVPPVAQVEPSPRMGTRQRWTPERLAELAADRQELGTQKAAEKHGMSAARLRELLPRTGKHFAGLLRQNQKR